MNTCCIFRKTSYKTWAFLMVVSWRAIPSRPYLSTTLCATIKQALYTCYLYLAAHRRAARSSVYGRERTAFQHPRTARQIQTLLLLYGRTLEYTAVVIHDRRTQTGTFENNRLHENEKMVNFSIHVTWNMSNMLNYSSLHEKHYNKVWKYSYYTAILEPLVYSCLQAT
jgi:hypothetical protein